MQSSTKLNSVDEAELKFFGRHSSLWWDVNGPWKIMHSENKIRVTFIRDGLINSGLVQANWINEPDVLKGMNILDVGCGAGILTEALGKLGANVIGIDPSEEMIQEAIKHAKGQLPNIKYACGVIEEYAINNAEKYDAVVASEVIEHVPVEHQKKFLHECTKCLKPNGSIFITTPNRTFFSWLFVKLIGEYIIKILPIGTHDWNNFISPEDVTKILNEQNCETVLVHGVWLNIWNRAVSFIGYNGIHYALQAVKRESSKNK